MVASAYAATGPVISSVTSSPTASGATIQWTTDTGANAQVLYGTSTMYTASTTPSLGYASTSQSVMLSNLTPGTLYHYAVYSGNASGTISSSTDYTFTTATYSPTITLTPANGMPGGSFAVTGSGFAPNEAVTLNFNGTTSTVNADANGDLTTTVTIPAGTANGNVWVTVNGATSATTTGAWFDVESSGNNSGSGSGSNSSSTDALQAELTQLQNLINQLAAQVQMLLSLGTTGSNGNSGSGNGGGTSTSTGTWPPTNLSATIDQLGPIRAGTSVDFVGRNWGAGEQVQIHNNGNLVTTAQADDGGNFSTGSLPVTNATGTQTYTFTGSNTGITRTVNVTIVP